MKNFKSLMAAVLTVAFLAAPVAGFSADAKPETKAKPYPLTTCVVSGEKLGEMGEAYVFTHEGQEVKLCCKSCLKDFNKNPKKYMAKLQAPAKDKK